MKVPDSITLLFGDEPLLVQEAADELRAGALDEGFDERLVLDADHRFDWGRLTEAAQSMSLFSSRRLIDLRLPSGKPGDAGTRVLVQFCEQPPPDTALLVVCGRLDARTRRTRWVKAIEKAGRVVEKKPVAPAQLPGWIMARARQRGIRLSQDAAALLSYFTEGNLLAAAQEVDKLCLLGPEGGEVGYDEVAAAITDSARFNVYTLVEHCVGGDAVKAMRSLSGLENEGTEPIIIVWALANQIRTLYRVCLALDAGQPRAAAFRSCGIWSRHVPLVNRALDRLEASACASLLKDAASLDRVLKGRETGNVWAGIERLCLAMCGIGCAKVTA